MGLEPVGVTGKAAERQTHAAQLKAQAPAFAQVLLSALAQSDAAAHGALPGHGRATSGEGGGGAGGSDCGHGSATAPRLRLSSLA
jgi:hypothetical protein